MGMKFTTKNEKTPLDCPQLTVFRISRILSMILNFFFPLKSASMSTNFFPLFHYNYFLSNEIVGEKMIDFVISNQVTREKCLVCTDSVLGEYIENGKKMGQTKGKKFLIHTIPPSTPFLHFF